MPQINFPAGNVVWPGIVSKAPTDNFAAIFEAYLTIDADEVYTFTLGSEDGSLLNLTDRTGREMTLIDIGGEHVMATTTASCFLAAGVYKVCTRICGSMDWLACEGHKC